MKYISLAILLSVWLLLTCVLALSFIGLMTVSLVDEDRQWLGFGDKIVDKF